MIEEVPDYKITIERHDGMQVVIGMESLEMNKDHLAQIFRLIATAFAQKDQSGD